MLLLEDLPSTDDLDWVADKPVVALLKRARERYAIKGGDVYYGPIGDEDCDTRCAVGALCDEEVRHSNFGMWWREQAHQLVKDAHAALNEAALALYPADCARGWHYGPIEGLNQGREQGAEDSARVSFERRKAKVLACYDAAIEAC